MSQIKNCRTCAHCEEGLTATSDYCILCGRFCPMVRTIPSPLCDRNLSGWTPRTLEQRLKANRFYIVAGVGFVLVVVSALLKVN